ncbi:MAG: hypothetical protein KAJ08_13950, partial [Deltaproteobacteria bacterium]|nr:hypothetical protein [Deltaproteobacteria bacterium]
MKIIDRARLKAPFSLRTKLIVSFIVIILVGGLGTTIIGTRLVATTLIEQAQRKVKHDLASAWMVYNERLKEIESVVRLTSQRFFLKEGIVLDDKDMLKRELERLRLENDLDILTLTDTKGKVLIRTRSPFTLGDDQSQDEIISLALQNKIIASTQ